MLRRTAKEALLLIFISVLMALVVYMVRPDKIEPFASPEEIDGPIQGTMAGQVPEMSLEEAVRLFKGGSALFVDSRHQADFEAGHIQGAVNLFLGDQEGWLPEFLATIDPTTRIITYCDGDECHLAPDLAEFLFFNGFDHVTYLKNGWSLWQEGGYPTNR